MEGRLIERGSRERREKDEEEEKERKIDGLGLFGVFNPEIILSEVFLERNLVFAYLKSYS